MGISGILPKSYRRRDRRRARPPGRSFQGERKRLDDMLLKRRKEIGARVTAEEQYEQMKGELAQFTSYARAVVVALALAALLVAAAFFTVFGIMGGFKASGGSQPPAVTPR